MLDAHPFITFKIVTYIFYDFIKILTCNIFMDIWCFLNAKHLNCLKIHFYKSFCDEHLGVHKCLQADF